MWKELMIKVLSNNFIRDLVNCGLRYILPQPVDMDITAIFYLLLLSTGMSGFLSALPDDQMEEETEELPESLMEAA